MNEPSDDPASQSLAALRARARTLLPEAWVSEPGVMEQVRDRLGDGSPTDDALFGLVLASACLLRVPGAVDRFHSLFAADIDRCLARLRLPADGAAETRQELLTELLVGSKERPPTLAEYRGDGDLRGFVRISATRKGLKLLRKEKPERFAARDEVIAETSHETSPELAYLKARYGALFRESLTAAFQALEPNERTLLRQHTHDGLSIDELAALHGTHRATAARWLQRARKKLAEHVQRELCVRGRIPEHEQASALRLVQSQLDMSLRSIAS